MDLSRVCPQVLFWLLHVHVQIVHAFYQSGRFDDANDHMFHVAKSADNHLLQQILRALPGVITQQFPGRELICK